MCVAVIINTNRSLSKEDLDGMELHNPDGAGLGWAEGGRVHWIKGLTAKEVHEWLPKLPRPVLLHFRFSTVGGKRADLCHPFPINAEADVRIKGTAGSLMIHNGHWYGWEKFMSVVSDDENPLPTGPWSDTRLTAFMMARFPDEVSEVVGLNGGKIAVLTGKGRVRRFGSWYTIDKKQYNGMLFSNTYWRTTPRWHTSESDYCSPGNDYTYTPAPHGAWNAIPRFDDPAYGKPIPGFQFVPPSDNWGSGFYRYVGEGKENEPYQSYNRSKSESERYATLPAYKSEGWGKPVKGFTFHPANDRNSGWYSLDPEPDPVVESPRSVTVYPEDGQPKTFDSYREYLHWRDNWRDTPDPDDAPTADMGDVQPLTSYEEMRRICGWEEDTVEDPYGTQGGEEGCA